MTLLEVFMESKEIKKLIVKRSSEYNIPLRYLCAEIGIDYTRFMTQYINSGNWHKYDITESQFRALLNVLAIDVRYQFVIDTSVDMVERSNEIANKYKTT